MQYLGKLLNEGLDKICFTESVSSETFEMFKAAYSGSYYTITGAGGDLNKWKEGYNELLAKENIGSVDNWITFTGTDMNAFGHLTANNAYPDDLTFLAFPLDNLDIGKLAIFKLKMEDRWFDDIVDNNARRQGYHPFRKSHYDESLKETFMRRYNAEVRKSKDSNVSVMDRLAAVLNMPELAQHKK